MFTCARIKATKGNGADFYRQHLSCNDYYSEHEVVKGVWHGTLADDFHLSGKDVSQSVFSAFQQNIDPVSGKKLTARNVENAVRFYDFQCSAQKSVSIMSLFDERLETAHQRAVQLAMKEMERFASVRLRSGINANTDNIEFTGNFIYAEYHHNSSRLLDPQLHTHNVIVNVTRDKNGKYKALLSREMVRAIRYASKVYLNKLAEECGILGYDLEKKYRDKGELVGFEIKGVSDEILKRFSRRREQIDRAIERFVETHGRQPSIDEVSQLTLLTRNRKMLSRTNAQVKEYKLSLFTEEEREYFRKMYWRANDRGAMFAPWLSDEARLAAVRKVAAQLFERESVITEDKLLAETLNQNLGKLNLEELKKDVALLPELVNLGEPSANPYITTREHMNHEAEILKLVSLMKEFETPLKSGYIPFSEAQDTFDHSAQKAVIEDILGSKNKFQIFRGVAGAGKTSTLQELCKCLKHGGVENIHVIAPTNSAVDVLRTEGFGSAQTVAKFLIDPKSLPPDGSYLIVDESGLNSVRQGHDMMQLALQHDYRILFVGDERQHSSVEAGDFFRLLEKYSDIDKTELAEIHRQQDEEYRRGILMASEGDVGGAFEQLNSHGFIHENQGRYLDAAADSFLRLTEDGKRPLDCIAVSPTNRECELLTEKIRAKMKSKGALDAGSERQVQAFRSWSWTAEKIADVAHYKPGMQVFLTSKIKEIGNAGEMFEVKAIEGKKLLLSNGQYVNPRQFKDRLDVGEARELAIAKGDVVRMTVNLKTPEYKINNGSLALATGNPNEFMLLDHNRKELTTVRLPENFRGFKYGWVITSHSSQGMTSKNVVVAAEKMSGQAFYVACSRGRKNLSLHVPEKEFFKDRLVKIPTERKLVTDISGGVTPWKAPVLPPPPAELIGSRLRQFMNRTREQMRKVQQIVSSYIERAMYHVFNHNIRKKDYDRSERIRKEFREKLAVQREREAAERAKFEAERTELASIEAEREKIKAERPRIEPEQPRVEPKPAVIEQTEKRSMSAAEYIAAEKARRAKEKAEREREIDRRIAAEQAERARKAAEYIAAEKARRAGQAPVEQPQPEIKPATSEPVKTFQPASWNAAVAKAREIEERAMRKMQEKAEAEQHVGQNKSVEVRRSPELDAEIAEWIREEIETPPIRPTEKELNDERERNNDERTRPESAGNGDERSRSEEEERRARLVALAEKRKRESPGGFDR